MTGLLTLLKMLMGFVIAKLIAVYSGPSGMAILGQVQSLISVLNSLVTAPVSNGIVRFTSEKHKEGFINCSPWWRASVQWVVILSLIIIPVGLFFSEYVALWLFHETEFRWVIEVSVVLLPITALGTFCNSVINGQQQYRRYVCLGMIAVTISSIIMSLMIWWAGIEGALLAAASQSAIIGAFMFLVNIRQPWLKLKYCWGRSTSKAKSDIGGYILMAITSGLSLPIALIFVRNILIGEVGWDETGHWQAVWKISEVYLGVITVALGTYYLPRLSSISKADEIITEIHQTAKLIIPLVIFLSLVVYLFRDLAIWLLFTKEFYSARELFSVQLMGDVMKIASWIYAFPMISRGETKLFITSEILFAFSFVFLTFIFVSEYKTQGANLAYFINYSIYFVFLFFNIKKIVR
ncbi:O-antigen translocase [Shewanella sp. A14]